MVMQADSERLNDYLRHYGSVLMSLMHTYPPDPSNPKKGTISPHPLNITPTLENQIVKRKRSRKVQAVLAKCNSRSNKNLTLFWNF